MPRRQIHRVAYPIVKELRARRLAMGLMIKTVAVRIGYHPHSIQMWEAGKTDPPLGTVYAWCRALECLPGLIEIAKPE